MPFIDLEGKKTKKNIFHKNNNNFFSYLWRTFVLLALIFIIFFHGLPNNEISYVLSFFKKNEYESLASKKIELQKKD